MKKKIIKYLSIASLSFAALSMGACAFPGMTGSEKTETTENAKTEKTQESKEKETEEAIVLPDKIAGLEFEKEIVPEEAKFFTIDCYKDGYYVIKTNNNTQQLLVVPEGKTAPEGLDPNVLVAQQPLDNLKIDPVSIISLMERIDPGSVNRVKLVALQKENIALDSVVSNMDNGTTQYSGSYNSPDIELVKNTSPKLYIANPSLKNEKEYKKLVKEGITPFISYVHQESSPLGRLEWIKIVGILLGNYEAAETYYNNQKQILSGVDPSTAGGKTYVIFCCDKADNKAYVRRAGDQISHTADLAGGKNMMTDTDKNSWEEMTLDDFAGRFKDADYLIYMNKREDNINTIEDFKNIINSAPDFKAVTNGNMWKTSTDYIQSMDNIGEIVRDLNGIFSGDQATMDSTANFIHIQ